MAPLTTFRIALNNLRRRPARSLGLALAVAAFSFAMFGGSLLSESVRNGMDSMSGRLGADILVVPHGYEKKLQAALLRGEPSTFYLKGGLAEKLAAIPGVEKVAPQLYLATLRAACCTLPIQIIAYDPASDFVIAPWVTKSVARPPADDEIVVGDMVAGDVGSELSLYGRIFRIAARLDRTGMGFDTTVFMTMNNARKMLKYAKNESFTHFTPDSVSSIMVGVAPDREPKDVANAILRNFAIDYNLDVVVSKSMISDIAKKLAGMSRLMHVMIAVFWLAATGALFLSFTLPLNERRREFGLFRILGATRWKLARIVLSEAALIGAAGGSLGVAAAAGLTLPFHRHLVAALELPYLVVPATTVLALAGGSLALSILAGPLASLYAVLKIVSGDAYLTLRRGE